MSERVLVTGGAGFIGSFLVDAVVERGHDVRIYDALVPQVHGPEQALPEYLNPEAEFIKGDVRDRDALARALQGIDVVYHLAAAVGVGQSMYEIQYYTEANTLGGAVLLDLLANTRHHVRKTRRRLVHVHLWRGQVRVCGLWRCLSQAASRGTTQGPRLGDAVPALWSRCAVRTHR